MTESNVHRYVQFNQRGLSIISHNCLRLSRYIARLAHCACPSFTPLQRVPTRTRIKYYRCVCWTSRSHISSIVEDG